MNPTQLQSPIFPGLLVKAFSTGGRKARSTAPLLFLAQQQSSSWLPFLIPGPSRGKQRKKRRQQPAAGAGIGMVRGKQEPPQPQVPYLAALLLAKEFRNKGERFYAKLSGTVN